MEAPSDIFMDTVLVTDLLDRVITSSKFRGTCFVDTGVGNRSSRWRNIFFETYTDSLDGGTSPTITEMFGLLGVRDTSLRHFRRHVFMLLLLGTRPITLLLF